MGAVGGGGEAIKAYTVEYMFLRTKNTVTTYRTHINHSHTHIHVYSPILKTLIT